jgi:hypothetical protein
MQEEAAALIAGLVFAQEQVLGATRPGTTPVLHASI